MSILIYAITDALEHFRTSMTVLDLDIDSNLFTQTTYVRKLAIRLKRFLMPVTHVRTNRNPKVGTCG